MVCRHKKSQVLAHPGVDTDRLASRVTVQEFILRKSAESQFVIGFHPETSGVEPPFSIRMASISSSWFKSNDWRNAHVGTPQRKSYRSAPSFLGIPLRRDGATRSFLHEKSRPYRWRLLRVEMPRLLGLFHLGCRFFRLKFRGPHFSCLRQVSGKTPLLGHLPAGLGKILGCQ